MKTVPIYCLLLLLFIINGFAYAQDDVNKNKLKKAIREAETYLELEEYHYVEEEMLEAVKYAPNNVMCQYYLGIAVFHDRNKNRVDALPYFEAAYRLDSKFRQINYWMAKNLQLSLQFSRAEKLYKEEKRRKASMSAEEKEAEKKTVGYIQYTQQELDRYIDQCQRGPEFMSSGDNKRLMNLSIANTYLPDITPIITVDGKRLYFTSHRQDVTSHDELDLHTQLPYQDVFYMDRKEDGYWDTPQAFTEINTDEHDAAIALTADGEQLFLYRSVGAATSNPGDIFEVNDYSGKWSKPKEVSAPINSSALETHMSMSSDGKVIIFTSDREQEDAMGGMDLYIIRQLPNGEWAEPQNMGDKINTNLNEESPYIHPNGKTLYFSSQGHHSIGGYDVFKVDIDLRTGDLGELIQLNYPVNSPSDDIFYVMSADGSEAYFSSVREEGMGDYDIYCIKNNESNVRSVTFFDLEFKTEDNKEVDVLVKLINVKTQEVEKEQRLVTSRDKLEWMHRCTGDYALEVYSDGYMLKSDRFNFSIIDQPTVSIKEKYTLQKFEVNKSEPLMNIYFDENQDIDLAASSSELKALKKFIDKHPGYSLEIVGHSNFDSKINKLVLEFISKTKSMETKEAMTTIGIADSQIVNNDIGYGIRYPLYLPDHELAWKNERMEYVIRPEGFQKLASRAADCSNGNYDTTHFTLQKTEVAEEVVEVNSKPLTHLLTQLKQCSYLELVLTVGSSQEYLNLSNEVIKYYENNGIPKDHLTLKMNDYNGFAMHLQQKAPNDYSGGGTGGLIAEDSNTPDSKSSISQSVASSQSISTEDLAFEKSIEDMTIVFPFDSKVFSKDNNKTLLKIKEYLNQNVSKSLTITGHTDSSGPEIYNEYLGLERAKSIAYFFNDIKDPNRIAVKSKGESSPIATNATREGRALNRRIHFKFGFVATSTSK